MEQNSVHWFSKGLRLHDNPSLREAIDGSSTFRGIFFLDEETVKGSTASPNRWRFLLESLRDLDRSLQRLNSRLFVIKGNPIQVLPRLLKQWKVSKLTFQYDSEPFSQRRDMAVRRLAERQNVTVISRISHTLYDVEKVLEANGNKSPVNFKQFINVIKGEVPEKCVDPVDKEFFTSCVTPLEENHEELYGIPTFEELGLNPADEKGAGVWMGGETEALRRLKEIAERSQYKKTFPLDGSPFPSSLRLSPYLCFGCLSVRYLYNWLSEVYIETHHSALPASLYRPLLWREFFFTLGSRNLNLDRMKNNNICIDFPWEEQAERLTSWKEGNTGFPWIDAIMRQLRQEGWIHHLARQAVGCFLTRGCLWVSWEEGFKYFEQSQLDAEWSLNAGGWLWLSCSSFFDKHPVWFCPVNTGRKLDPQGTYIRKYVPELQNFPSKFIHEPWKAPLDVQQASGCIVGTTYPLPLLDHEEARNICVARMRDVFRLMVTEVSREQSCGRNAIHWFRKDLRLHDNPALRESLNSCKTFYGIYVIDPIALKDASMSYNQYKFLLESLADLDRSLRACGTRLYVVRGQLTNILPKLFMEWNITRLTFESDSEPFGQQRDLAISLIAEDHGVEVISKTSHTLYDPNRVIEANNGKVPMTFKDFEEVLKTMEPPEKPVKTVDRKAFSSTICPVFFDHDNRFGLPTLQELGLKSRVSSGSPFKGGEQEACSRLQQLKEKILCRSHKKKVSPQDSLYPTKTQLSPYMRFGCLSPRMLFHQLTLAYTKVNHQPPPMSLYQHLAWREFFFTLGSQNLYMDKMRNNPICLQIPWDEDLVGLERWKMGKTGFPWIDAIMRQLKQEGWVHHIARQTVACFLTRGCLWINWEEGFKYFEQSQLDAEWSLNAGSWLWLSCSAFFKGKMPWFCPVNVGKKMDPTGNYVRKYLPELRTMPTKYIYEPWLAPIAIQKAANCVVGKHYPERLADHMERRQVCLDKLQLMCEELTGSRA